MHMDSLDQRQGLLLTLTCEVRIRIVPRRPGNTMTRPLFLEAFQHIGEAVAALLPHNFSEKRP